MIFNYMPEDMRCFSDDVKVRSLVSTACPPDTVLRWDDSRRSSVSSTAEVRVSLSERDCGGAASLWPRCFGRNTVSFAVCWLSNELPCILPKHKKPFSYLFVELGSCCSLIFALKISRDSLLICFQDPASVKSVAFQLHHFSYSLLCDPLIQIK